MKVVDAVDEVLNRIQQQRAEQELPEGIMALPLLQMAYRGKVKLTPQQARAAIEALPYETPKLTAVAHAHFEGKDFASQLERAIARSRGETPAMLTAPKVIEHSPPPEHDGQEMKGPMSRYRRY